MPDLNMIPASYRTALRVEKSVAVFCAVSALVLIAGVLAYGFLQWRLAENKPRLARLKAETAATEASRKQLETARVQYAALDQSMKALAALRGAGEIERMTRALDASLGPLVWFTELRYNSEERALAPLTASSPSGASATAAKGPEVDSGPALGTLLVLPIDANGKTSATEKRSWRLAKSIEIKGEAGDHAVLTDFMKSLSAQAAIAEVRFLNSNVRSAPGTLPVVEFSAAAIMRPPQPGVTVVRPGSAAPGARP